MDLNEEAWTRWKQYRSAIKKPIKEASEEAMKLALTRHGDHETQAKVVDQSIANQWQGLFELKAKKDVTDKFAPPKRTKEQETAAQASFAGDQAKSEKHWREHVSERGGLGLVHVAEAYLARAEVTQDHQQIVDTKRWLADKVSLVLWELPAADVAKDLRAMRLIWQLFGEGRVREIESAA